MTTSYRIMYWCPSIASETGWRFCCWGELAAKRERDTPISTAKHSASSNRQSAPHPSLPLQPLLLYGHPHVRGRGRTVHSLVARTVIHTFRHGMVFLHKHRIRPHLPRWNRIPQAWGRMFHARMTERGGLVKKKTIRSRYWHGCNTITYVLINITLFAFALIIASVSAVVDKDRIGLLIVVNVVIKRQRRFGGDKLQWRGTM